MKFKLRRNEFREWLKGFKPMHIVGTPRDGDLCPLSTYIAAKTQGTPFVSRTTIRLNDSDLYKRIPRWVRVFVDEVDDKKNVPFAKRVTAKKALTILDRIE